MSIFQALLAILVTNGIKFPKFSRFRCLFWGIMCSCISTGLKVITQNIKIFIFTFLLLWKKNIVKNFAFKNWLFLLSKIVQMSIFPFQLIFKLKWGKSSIKSKFFFLSPILPDFKDSFLLKPAISYHQNSLTKDITKFDNFS